MRDRALCGRCNQCLSETDAEPAAKPEADADAEFCGACGVQPVALQHVGCCPKESDKPLTQRVTESIQWRLNNWCTPWAGEEKKEEKKADAAAQIDADAEQDDAADTKKCDIGEQVAKAIECKEKQKSLQQKVAESIQWHAKECNACGACAQTDAEQDDAAGDAKKCDIGEQVAKAIECKEKNKPLQQKVAESIQWHAKECNECGSCP